MNTIQKYTDLTYGALLLIGLVSVMAVETALAVGFGIGLFIGYCVHVGSKMFEHKRDLEAVEESVKGVKEHSEETVEKVEETVEKVQETQETVEKVEEKADRVESAVNGN